MKYLLLFAVLAKLKLNLGESKLISCCFLPQATYAIGSHVASAYNAYLTYYCLLVIETKKKTVVRR